MSVVRIDPKKALEEQSTQPEIIVVPQAMQEPQADGENALEVSGEEVPSVELAEQIAVHRGIPIEDPEEMVAPTQILF